jgi:hypothetical protein
MAKTPTFGFSAFLKLNAANEKPQKTEIKKRLLPVSKGKGGYDFHKSMRHLAQKLLLENIREDELTLALQAINRPAELTSARNALQKLVDWRARNPGRLSEFQGVKYESPNSIFKVDFSWDFGIELNGRRTAIHLWNTKIKLSSNVVLGILTLLPECYDGNSQAPEDFAVLSLKDLKLYRWSESGVDHKILGKQLISHLEKNFELVKSQIGDAEARADDLGDDIHPSE